MLAKYINKKQIERYRGFVIIDGITYANNEEKATEYLDYYYIDGEVITQK